MTPLKRFSKFPVVKKTVIRSAFALTIAGTIFSACSSGSSEQQYELQTKVELTKGLITEVEEVEQDIFKITDETVIENKEDSRIIAAYLDGQRDTFTLEEAKLVDAESATPRRRGMNGVLMGGVMGYYMGRSLSSPINKGAYKSPQAYQKSQTKAGSTVKQTAKRSTVRKPVNSSKGFGGGKSTRSFGG